MKKRVSKDEVGQTIKAIEEATRLTSIASFNNSLAPLLPQLSSIKIQNGIVQNEPLTRLLANHRTPLEFFSLEIPSGVSESLIQILVLDYYYRRDLPEVSTIALLSHYYENHEELDQTYLRNLNHSLFVAYLEHFGYISWNELSLTFEGDWTSIFLLNDSLPFCHVSLEAMFRYIKVSREKNPGDIGVRTLRNHILLKLQTDGNLLNESYRRLPDIIDDPALKEVLPIFLIALIKNDSKLFLQYVKELPLIYREKHPLDIYFALGIACPEDEEALAALKASIDNSLYNNNLTRSQYLQVSSVKSLKSVDIIELVENISNSSDNNDELIQATLFLITHVDDHEESWFLRIGTGLIIRSEKHHDELLANLVDSLKDKNLLLVYALLSKRFDILGIKGALENVWPELVELDPKLFSRNLTLWLKDGSDNTLWALSSLCNIREIPVSYFRVSLDDLKTSSASERLYIAYKIAGFIYSPGHLQQLLFSIIETIKDNEEPLLNNLYSLFCKYLIYNYRGTLKLIDQILQDTKLPDTIRQFYNSVRLEYNQYFAELNNIRTFKELEPDSRLFTHLQFYNQEMYSSKFGEVEKTGIRKYFKNTPVHSLRWAIRRQEQPIHEVRPLQNIQSSVEFPSGQKLNPVYQEHIRRTYQNLKKDEVDIG